MTEKIRTIHREHRKVYGSPRIHAELRMTHAIRVGRKRVERLMRQSDISGLIRKKRGRTTILVPGIRVADDLVERQFCPPGPNVLWLADIASPALLGGLGLRRRDPGRLQPADCRHWQPICAPS